MGVGFGGVRWIADRGFIVCAIGERMVKKSDIVERVAGETGVRKRAARTSPSRVSGDFPERAGQPAGVRNPRTGEPVAIGRSNTVSFRAGKELKDALN